MQKMFTLIVFCFFLMSCGITSQAPVTTYYLLDAEPLAQKQKVTSARIKLEKINIPDYLSTNQLVMRDSGHILIKASYHSWADSLDDAIQRALLNDLNNLNEQSEFVGWCSGCDSISVTIEHFYPAAEGTLLLSGFFELYSKDGETKLFRFQLVNNLSTDGYANAVKQMREQVGTLAAQINHAL
nr:ABC-type transport auxiliary lipoprotein family protein [uncultured Glaciecola sp.]